MRYPIIYESNTGLEIVTFIIVILILVAMTYFLARSFFKERRRHLEEKALVIDGVLTKSEMHSVVASYIARGTDETQFSLIYLDLDKFTDFVNAFGKKESEKIIERIVKHIEYVLPKGVKVARMQTDEFLIFMSMDYDRAEVVDLANKIRLAIGKNIKLFGDTQINATASIAIAFYPVHGQNIRDLLNSLQIATYIIKKNGGDSIRVYSEEMDNEGGEHVEYYYQIKHAIQHKEFQLFYHPMIDVKNNTIYGAEALIRWNHPEHGLLSPFKFLGIMEQSGDVHWIGLWGLETLIKTYQELKQTFPKKDLVFSMNLSPKQLMHTSLPQDFQKILKKYRMDARHIVLEVIEFAIFERQETIFKNIHLLKEMGFKIAIDGFGLDYQTLAKAEKLDIDIIKLDNEFLKESEAYMKAKFAQLLVEFAHKNAYTVISEMIEDEQMMHDSASYEIDIMQGFYFTKPMSAEALRSYIELSEWSDKI